MGIFNNGDVLICVLYEIVSQGMTGCLYTRKVSSYIFCARKKERKDTKKKRETKGNYSTQMVAGFFGEV